MTPRSDMRPDIDESPEWVPYVELPDAPALVRDRGTVLRAFSVILNRTAYRWNIIDEAGDKLAC